MPLRVFVVDDDPEYATLLRYQIRREAKHDVERFGSGEDLLAHLRDLVEPSAYPDLVLMDVMMPGMGGLETLRHVRREFAEVPVVMVSAQSVVGVALEALDEGAYDYITKGYDDQQRLGAILRRIDERASLARQVLAQEARLPEGFGLLVGESTAMQRVYRLVQKTLRGDLTVAIQGESGTGKELVAQAIHTNSPRRKKPFVIVNCAAIPHELMESEFFGHEKGSFTGAHARKIGKFEQADGGTIFLDEIGEMDLGLQAKILRVLQEQTFSRVGGNETIQVDVRVISATNRDIVSMIREGTFREDLYYRLFQFPIVLPPLRERDQDALLIANHIRKAYLRDHPDLDARTFSPAARRAILGYRWPGNVRQLKNAIERALLLAEDDEVQPDDLMLPGLAPTLPEPHAARVRHDAAATPSGDPAPISSAGIASPQHELLAATDPDEIIALEDLKKLAIEHAYHLCEGNIEKTSNRLGITRSTVYRLMKKYEIEALD